jgi:hypothetical protein
MEQTEKIERLRAMLDHARALARTDDPILRGQGPILVGILADILRAEDPWIASGPVVDDE